MKNGFLPAAALALLMLSGCDDDTKQRFEGNDNHIASFALTTPAGEEYRAAIAGDRIVVTAPRNVSLEGASVAYELCERAVVFPAPEDIRDWDAEHLFRVVAYDGGAKDYLYTVERTEVGSEGTVVLLHQADVEAFAASGATTVEGSLIIGSVGAVADDPVVDLRPLSALTEVRHDIVVNDSFAGTTLEGLEHIVRAGGLTLGTASAPIAPPSGVAVSLPGLETLGALQVNSPGVTVLRFPALKSVGSIYIDAELLTMAEFPALAVCDGHLTVKSSAGNAYLAALALPALEHVRGSLTVEKCTALEALSLPVLAAVDGDLHFTNLAALGELTLPSLSACGGSFACTSLDKAARIALPALTAVPKDLTLTGSTYTSATVDLELPQLEEVGSSLTVKMAALGMESLSLPALRRVGGKLDIEYLKFLTDLALPQLREVGTSVYLCYLSALPALDIAGIAELPALQLISCPALASLKTAATLNDVTFNAGSQVGAAVPSFGRPTVIRGKLDVSGYRYSTESAWMLRDVTEIGTFTYSGSGTAGTAVLTFADLERIGTFRVGSGQYFRSLSFPKLKEVTELFSLEYSQNIGNGEIRIPELRKIGTLVFNGSTYKMGATSFTRRTTLEDFAGVTHIGELTVKWWGALTDFSGLAAAAASVPADKWHIEENALGGSFEAGYNPTRQDILDGRYTRE